MTLKHEPKRDPDAVNVIDALTNYCWHSVREDGEPPVTDTRFVVLLIKAADDSSSTGSYFLRPHYPGAKKPVPDDALWILLPEIPKNE